MSEITLNINGKRVKVDRSFLDLSPEQQEATVEEIAASIGGQSQGNNFMGFLNQGIANGAGGVVDLLNPFDKPHALNPFGEGTGSAVDGLQAGMDAIGVNRPNREPSGLVENFASGMGEAAGAAPFAGAAMQGLSKAPGIFGAIAGDASQAMNTVRGTVSEFFAGGGAQAGQSAAAEAGAPDWAQMAAGVLGGAGVGLVPGAVRSTPSAIGARKLTSAVKSAMLPYTEAGGKEVARQRLQELAGGSERANELAKTIGNTEIGLSPAKQTSDPNLLGLEQEAMRRNPVLRERLNAQAEQGQQEAVSAIRDMGGDVVAAQSFLEARRADARKNIMAFVDRATDGALRPTARNSEMINSDAVAEKIRLAERAADQQERALWEAIPKSVQVGTENAKRAAAELIASTPRAQQGDIPKVMRDLLSSEAGFGDFEPVSELHGLYSELRRVARSAKAGNDQNRNMARISNEVAQALLDDMGANADQTAVGRAIDAARAFSAEKNEIFSQGVVGKLLKRTLDGDESINPALTLERSIARGGATGAVGADDIMRAAGPDAEMPLEDYLRSRFDRSAFSPDGSYSASGAQRFMRDNSDLLQRFPHTRDMFDEAVRTQGSAAATSKKAERALTDMQNPSKSVGAAFTQAAPENAIDAVFKAKRPAQAALQLAATARKDKTGEAISGLKGAFSDYLIRRSSDANGLSGDVLLQMLEKPQTRAALSSVFSKAEINRIGTIGGELRKIRAGQKPAPDIGGLSPRSPNRLIEMAARVIAARQGAKAGGGSSGASIQTANMASGRMKDLLGNLQNDKAEQMLMDAVQDPELFRLLLTDMGKVELKPDQINRLAPYFVGTASALSVN